MLQVFLHVSQLYFSYLHFYTEKKNHHITENLLSYIRFFFHFNFQGFLWLFCMSEIICLFWEGGKYVLEVISVK